MKKEHELDALLGAWKSTHEPSTERLKQIRELALGGDQTQDPNWWITVVCIPDSAFSVLRFNVA